LTPSKILIVRLRRAGDIIMTTPAVTLLRKHFPAAKLAYLVEEPFRRLVEGNPDLDRVIAVSPKPPFADFIRLIREVRHEAYDILIDLHGGPRASWITFWSGAKVKAGYEIKGKRFLYDVRVSRRGTGGPVHSVQNHANLVRALGAEFDDAEIPALSLPRPSRRKSSGSRRSCAERRMTTQLEKNSSWSSCTSAPATASGTGEKKISPRS